MKKIIRLTESDIHRIVKNSVKRILKEGLYDPDDDNEIYDTGLGGQYRITWEFKDTRDSYGRYETLSSGQKILQSKDEAFGLANELKEKYHGSYATDFKIEQLIKTLSDDRWETIYDYSNGYV